MIYTAALLLLALLLYGCNDYMRKTGTYVNREKSEYYRYGRYDKNKIFYFANAYLGNTPKEIAEADNESFEVIGRYWAKDKYAIYRKNICITGVDAASFTVDQPSADNEDQPEVLRDKNCVYRINANHTALLPVEHADPATFHDMGKHGWNHWATDREHVFLDYEVFEADVATFSIINQLFSKDKDHLFMTEYKIRVAEKTNAENIKLINMYHIRTDGRIYFFAGSPDIPTSFPIRENAEIEDFESSIHLLKVDGRIYIKGTPYHDGAMDMENFRYLGGRSYFNDGRRIYYYGWNWDKILPVSSDAVFFSTVGDFGKDSRHVYYHNIVVEGADPTTFHHDEKNDKVYDSQNEYIYDPNRKNYVKRERR